MEVRKLLIAEGTEEFRLALADALSAVYQVRTCRDGREAMELLRSFNPDMMVLDLMLPGLDGISILQRATEEGIRPQVLATTRFHNDYVSEAMIRFRVDYLMMKPCDVVATVDRIADLSHRISQPAPAQPDARSQVSNVLISLGVATKLHGFLYLREAILLAAEKPGQSITKELYPQVAVRCGCDASHVERCARSAIGTAWKKRNEEAWKRYFQPGEDGTIRRPTNGEFITAIAEKLRLPLEREC